MRAPRKPAGQRQRPALRIDWTYTPDPAAERAALRLVLGLDASMTHHSDPVDKAMPGGAQSAGHLEEAGGSHVSSRSPA